MAVTLATPDAFVTADAFVTTGPFKNTAVPKLLLLGAENVTVMPGTGMPLFSKVTESGTANAAPVRAD
jgi:hypothetical protein